MGDPVCVVVAPAAQGGRVCEGCRTPAPCLTRDRAAVRFRYLPTLCIVVVIIVGGVGGGGSNRSGGYSVTTTCSRVLLASGLPMGRQDVVRLVVVVCGCEL